MFLPFFLPATSDLEIWGQRHPVLGDGGGRDVQRWSGSSRHQRDNARWWIRGISGPWKMYEVSGVGLRLAGYVGWDAGILTLWSRQLGYYIRDYVDFARIIITKCRWSSYLRHRRPRRIFIFVSDDGGYTRCVQIYPSRLEDFQFCYVSRSSLTIKSCRSS